MYFKNKKDKTLTLHEKEALDQYYVDYKAIKGNSYIDKYYNRMRKWQVIDDDEEDGIEEYLCRTGNVLTWYNRQEVLTGT